MAEHFMASWTKANGTFSMGTLLQKDVQKLTATNTVSWNLESHPTESLGQKPHSKTLNLDC